MGAVGFDFKDWARSTLGVQINGNSNQSQGSKGPHNKSTPDLNGPEVVKRVEKRLTILESYLRSSGGEQREMLKRKTELLRSKLQRYYFLAKLFLRIPGNSLLSKIIIEGRGQTKIQSS